MNAETKIKIPGGLFVTLEGLESSGKSTQGKLLKEHFEQLGFDVILVGEPGGTPYGQKARKLFLEEHQEMVPEAEVGLLLTCKAQLLRTVIEPALAAGQLVICDRYTDTLFAYQHHAKGHSRAMISQLLKAFHAERMPHITLLYDIPAELSIQRSLARQQQGGEFSSFDAAELEFHNRVRAGLYVETGVASEIRVDTGNSSRQSFVISGSLTSEEVLQISTSILTEELEKLTPPEVVA